LIVLKMISSGMSTSSPSADFQLNRVNGSSSGTITSRIAMGANGRGTMNADIPAASDNDLSDQPDMDYLISRENSPLPVPLSPATRTGGWLPAGLLF
jgi:hypothetical protein